MKAVKVITSSFELKKDLTTKSFGGSSFEKPSPLDFDTFVPWACLACECPVIIAVMRYIQEDYINTDKRRSSSKSAKSNKSKNDDYVTSSSRSSESELCPFKSADKFVPLTAIYDIRGQLTEISIEKCPIDIDRKIIQVLSLCLSYHLFLCKLSIRSGGITSMVLHEIGKLLPHSNLTNICLDNSNVPEANYHVLLEHTSQLKTLSLNRCRINDTVCKHLAAKLDFGSTGSNLLTLELGSNQISDAGAKLFGDVLRRNRHLVHLNLSGNMITDSGAQSILDHLMEFALTRDEILEHRLRKLKYIQDKTVLINQCLEEVMAKRKSININRRKSSSTKGLKGTKSSPSAIMLEECPLEVAENMAKQIIGEFSDPFNTDYMLNKDEYYFSIGNMRLCSLNLAFNNLEYQSLKKIKEVVIYQAQMTKPPGTTGLLRVLIDGNSIPEYCKDYVDIGIVLSKAIYNRSPIVLSPTKKKARQSKVSIKRFFKY